MPAFKQVNCPNCQKIVRWCDEEVFRPFCSKQCQLVDFGAWANEQHRIPTEEDVIAVEDEEDAE
jgi:endogenous inhibitor of DNA gyrase (YacG/DUF329 family)